MTELIDCCFGWEVREFVTDVDIDAHPLWASVLVHSHRSQCVEAYRSLIRAGANAVITPSYQGTVWGFQKHLGLTEEQAKSCLIDSVAICKEAISLEEKAQGKSLKIRVYAVIGPYGAHLCNGSEYTGIYPPEVDKAEMIRWHSIQLNIFIETDIDGIVLVTCPRVDEALIFVDLLKSLQVKIDAWVSFSAKKAEQISCGDNFVEAASKIWDAADGRLMGIGLNCCPPSIALASGKALRLARPDIPFIPMPNSSEKFCTTTKRYITGESEKSLPEYTENFLDLGVKHTGCCCRNYAKDMAAIRKKIDDYKAKQ